MSGKQHIFVLCKALIQEKNNNPVHLSCYLFKLGCYLFKWEPDISQTAQDKTQGDVALLTQIYLISLDASVLGVASIL